MADRTTSMNFSPTSAIFGPVKRKFTKTPRVISPSEYYDKTYTATQHVFAETQNKLIYGIIGQTAAELIMSRADATKPNMTGSTFDLRGVVYDKFNRR